MSKKITYTDGPIGEVKIIRNFLPAPAELAFREEQVKVTIGLSKDSIDFFKREAKEHHVGARLNCGFDAHDNCGRT